MLKFIPSTIAAAALLAGATAAHVSAAPIAGPAREAISAQDAGALPIIEVQGRRGGNRGAAGRGPRGPGPVAPRRSRSRDIGAGVAAGVIGLAIGSMIAAESARQSRAGNCARYRGFDPNSMTFRGRDGRRYRCP